MKCLQAFQIGSKECIFKNDKSLKKITMNFIDIYFALFVLIALLPYYFLKHSFQAIWLCIASSFIIAWYSIFSLAGVYMMTAIAYFGGIALQKNPVIEQRTKLYYGVIIWLLSVLIVGKYYIGQTFAMIGISYYFLQAFSYISDTRYQSVNAEKRPEYLLLYLVFFPKIASGPIEKPKAFFKQIQSLKQYNPSKISLALQRLLIGLFKKIVLAESLVSLTSDTLSPDNIGMVKLIGMFAYTLQIYFDLSGYTDMGIGLAGLFGYTLTENFQNPFTASSVTEFWKRWHISLMRWLTEYIYKPISFYFRQNLYWANIAGIVATFFVSGLWHYVSWHYLAWAMVHTFYMLYEFMSQNARKKYLTGIKGKIIGTPLVWLGVSIANLFLFFPNPSEVFYFFHTIFFKNDFLPTSWDFDVLFVLAGNGEIEYILNFYFSTILIFLFLAYETAFYTHYRTHFSWLIIYLFLLLITIFGHFIDAKDFIYIRF